MSKKHAELGRCAQRSRDEGPIAESPSRAEGASKKRPKRRKLGPSGLAVWMACAAMLAASGVVRADEHRAADGVTGTLESLERSDDEEEGFEHVVGSGETLSHIAVRFDVS